jgi:RimJ/RimL family protein N-acetyltransferase
MSIATPLFEGKLVRLGAIDHEKDPAIVSRWTHDSRFMRMMYTEPMSPQAPWQVKKSLEGLEKRIDEEHNLFHFRIRLLADERLLGFAELFRISWTNATGMIRLGIGDPADWRKGYGREALRLVLQYSLSELNLHRLTAMIPEYNQPALALFHSFGFVDEVRRRQALNRDGRTWDLFHLGLLAGEYKEDNHE